MWACERFSLYLHGLPFELETDHKPLENIFSAKSKPPARIERWVLRLQAFNMKVVYRPGKTNIADCLSRLNRKPHGKGAKSDEICALVECCVPNAITVSEFEEASKSDQEIELIRDAIMSGQWKDSKMTKYLHVKDELCVYGNIVLRGTRLLVPESLRKRSLELAHEGHQGIVKTKARLRTKVWWPKMDKDTEKYCKSCYGCQMVSHGPNPEPMARVVPPSGPWQDCALDLMGPLPTGETLAVIVDYYSRYFEVGVFGSTVTSKIVSFLTSTFARFGIPYSLRTDNGPQFISEEFQNFVQANGIEHYTSTPLWPQANGEVERQNRTLLKCLTIAHAEGKTWREELQSFLMAYRSTPQVSTGVSPYSLMFGREMKTKLPQLRPEETILNESVRDRDMEYKISQKLYADKCRGAKFDPIDIGDDVLVRTPKTNKLSPKYHAEPGTIVKRIGGEVTVQRQDGTQIRRHTTAVKKLVHREPEKTSHQDRGVVTNSGIQNDPIETSSEIVPREIDNNINDTIENTLPTSGRPARTTKLPEKFKDFVMK